MSMQHDSHARFYQFRQADIFDKPEQNIRDGHGPQIQRGHATAVGPAPAPVREESVADSVDGDEEEMTEQVQHYLTHDGHGCHGRVVGMPVLYQRKEMLHALDQSESSVVLGGYAGSSRQRN